MRWDGLKWTSSILIALSVTFLVLGRLFSPNPQYRGAGLPSDAQLSPYSVSDARIRLSRHQLVQDSGASHGRLVRLRADRPHAVPASGQFDSTVPENPSDKKHLVRPKTEPKKKCRKKGEASDEAEDAKTVLLSEDVRFSRPKETSPTSLAANSSPESKNSPSMPESTISPSSQHPNKMMAEECDEDQDTTSNEVSDKPDESEMRTADDKEGFDSRKGSTAETVSGFGVPGVGPPNITSEFGELQLWKSRLLFTPDFSATVELIQKYQQGQVGAELFYQVIGLMLQSPNPQIQDYGVLAVGRTPSPKSFVLLTEIIQSGSYSGFAKGRAQSEMRFYEQPQFLNVLDQVLKESNDLRVVILAAQQVDQSAQRFLAANTGGASTPAGGVAGAQANHAKGPGPAVKQIYQRLAASLEQVIKEVPTGDSGPVKQSLDRIRQLLQVLG